MSIIGIVATDRNNAIGKAGGLPWRYTADMRFFKEQTMGNACVMGRRTWTSLKQPLPNRLNIVLSGSMETSAQPSVIVLRDKASVLALRAYLSCDLFIIGGASVYATFSDVIERWIVTQIPESVEGADTFMPPNFLEGFKQSVVHQIDENLRAVVYERS